MPKILNTKNGFVVARTKHEISIIVETYRGREKLTKKDFAQAIGTTPQNYQHILNGDGALTIDNLCQLKAMGHDIFQLIELNKEEKEDFLKTIKKKSGGSDPTGN